MQIPRPGYLQCGRSVATLDPWNVILGGANEKRRRKASYRQAITVALGENPNLIEGNSQITRCLR